MTSKEINASNRTIHQEPLSKAKWIRRALIASVFAWAILTLIINYSSFSLPMALSGIAILAIAAIGLLFLEWYTGSKGSSPLHGSSTFETSSRSKASQASSSLDPLPSFNNSSSSTSTPSSVSSSSLEVPVIPAVVSNTRPSLSTSSSSNSAANSKDPSFSASVSPSSPSIPSSASNSSSRSEALPTPPTTMPSTESPIVPLPSTSSLSPAKKAEPFTVNVNGRMLSFDQMVEENKKGMLFECHEKISKRRFNWQISLSMKDHSLLGSLWKKNQSDQYIMNQLIPIKPTYTEDEQRLIIVLLIGSPLYADRGNPYSGTIICNLISQLAPDSPKNGNANFAFELLHKMDSESINSTDPVLRRDAVQKFRSIQSELRNSDKATFLFA